MQQRLIVTTDLAGRAGGANQSRHQISERPEAVLQNEFAKRWKSPHFRDQNSIEAGHIRPKNKVEHQPTTLLQGVDRIYDFRLDRSGDLKEPQSLAVDDLREQRLFGSKAAIDRLLAGVRGGGDLLD
jgi:hypothetical protein